MTEELSTEQVEQPLDGIVEEREYTEEEMHALIDDTITDFDDGDLVNGTVVQVEKDEVLLDIGYKSEGVIPVRELSIRKDADPGDIVSLGDEIEALVLQKEDKDGRLILSKKRAEYERAWGRIEEKFESGEVVEGEVIEVVKGGLIIDIGLRGFLPASLVDLRRVKDLSVYTGTKLEARVIEMDRNRNNVVLSRRVVLEEGRKHERQEVLNKLHKGQILPGTVSSIVDFGAFVDLGGIDGLVHISELSWSHVTHPSEVVSVNDAVEVMVLDVDMDRERISLGLKQTQDDPWKQLVQAYEIGGIFPGKITKLVPFGAFVELGDAVEGLVHISEMARGHVETPDQVVEVGEEVQVKVQDIDLARRRISLSIRAAADELDIEIKEPPEREEGDEDEGDDAEFVAVDVDGDGIADVVAVDVDGDGTVDAVAVDVDGDGEIDAVVATAEVDTDGDGEPDTIVAAIDADADGDVDAVEIVTAVDTDGDGEPDTIVETVAVIEDEPEAAQEEPAEEEAEEPAEEEAEEPAEEEAAASEESEEDAEA